MYHYIIRVPPLRPLSRPAIASALASRHRVPPSRSFSRPAVASRHQVPPSRPFSRPAVASTLRSRHHVPPSRPAIAARRRVPPSRPAIASSLASRHRIPPPGVTGRNGEWWDLTHTRPATRCDRTRWRVVGNDTDASRHRGDAMYLGMDGNDADASRHPEGWSVIESG